MAIVSGRLVFDLNRSATINAGDTGIGNVPIVLQDMNTANRLVVLTDVNGNYAFGTVPDGSYRIVEAYGVTGGVPTPGDFSTATPGAVPVGQDPPISFATTLPAGATNLDSLTPNTIFITVAGADVTNQNFLDGPVKYTPISTILDACVTVTTNNLITVADFGTFGTLPAGTAANTGPATVPYPGVTTGFTYVVASTIVNTPEYEEYTVQNIMSNTGNNRADTWWRIADHTMGDETGRFMAVNGANPGARFFTQTIPVTPNSNYLFSSWILNLMKVLGQADPALGVEILDQNGNVLYDQTLGNAIPVNQDEPEWKQIGTVINSENNTQLTIAFLSQGAALTGNDYCIDDITFNEVQVPQFIPKKSISSASASVGNTVTYTLSLTNTCSSSLTNLLFLDTMPVGVSFHAQTVAINGVSNTSANPEIGFTVPDLAGRATVTVTFVADVVSVPQVNPTLNAATVSYNYTPVQGGIPNRYTHGTNTVPLLIGEEADLAIVKSVNPNPVESGITLTYTLLVDNMGPSPAINTIVEDSIPGSIQSPKYSVDGGSNWLAWTGSLNLGTLAASAVQTILIQGIVNAGFAGTIINTATVTSNTPDPNLGNNASTVTVPANASADIAVVKTVTTATVVAGNTINYRVVVTNNGPSQAQNVNLGDTLPAAVQNPQYSTNEGTTWSAWSGSLNLGMLASGSTSTILIRGTVDPLATGNLVNTAIGTSTTPDPNPPNNSSTVTVPIGSLADLAIVKTETPNPVIPGETITYTLVVRNSGPSQALGVVVNDALPTSIQNPQYSLDGGTSWLAWTGSLTVGTLAVNGLVTIPVRGMVSTSAVGTLINTATVVSITPDPNLNNNTSTVIVPANPSADLLVLKTATTTIVVAGNTINYAIVVANQGPSDAQSVSLTDTVPIAVQNPQYSIDQGTNWAAWSGSLALGTVAAASVVTILMRGKVDSTATGNLVNTAIGTSTTPDPNPTNNKPTVTIPIGRLADLAIVKTDYPDPVIASETLTYTLVITNNGPSSAIGTVVSDAIPTSVQNPRYSLNGGTNWAAWNGSINLGTLAVSTVQTVLIQGQVDPGFTGTLINTATVTSNTPDPNLTNNTSATLTTVNGSADVAIVKTASQNSVVAGSTINYTIVVSNNGPSDAESVVVNDTIPSTITHMMYSLNGGMTWLPWTGSLTLGRLGTGRTVIILMSGHVDGSATEPIINTATVTSTTPDPDPSNNASTVRVNVTVLADVAIVKKVTPDPAIAGQMMEYTLTIENFGPSTARGVVVNDTLPNNIQNPQYRIDALTNWLPWTGSLYLGDLAVGETVTISIMGCLCPDEKGELINTAVVGATTPDPNLNNNISTIRTKIEALADLCIVKTSRKNPVQTRGAIYYDLEVRNNGPSNASDVVIYDSLPTGIDYPEYSWDGGMTWMPWTGGVMFKTVAVGSLINILIRGRVSPGVTCFINTAVVSSATPDPNVCNNSSTNATRVDIKCGNCGSC